MPVIGFLDVAERSNRLAEFNRGLVEVGYVEARRALRRLKKCIS